MFGGPVCGEVAANHLRFRRKEGSAKLSSNLQIALTVVFWGSFGVTTGDTGFQKRRKISPWVVGFTKTWVVGSG